MLTMTKRMNRCIAALASMSFVAAVPVVVDAAPSETAGSFAEEIVNTSKRRHQAAFELLRPELEKLPNVELPPASARAAVSSVDPASCSEHTGVTKPRAVVTFAAGVSASDVVAALD